jgi:hypothetical protein
MKMPITMVIGAAIIIVHVITTSICTCWTSLVMRVISDGAPKLADLAGRVAGDLVEQVAPDVAAEPHRRRATVPHRADGEHDLHEREGEHHAPVRQM